MALRTHQKVHCVAMSGCQKGGVPLPVVSVSLSLSLSSYVQGFVLLILLECKSYHHLEEFITLSPSLLARLRRLSNKRAIVWLLNPEFRYAGTGLSCT